MSASNNPIHDAIFARRKITAIKLYREQTKAGLAEAKLAVEKMEAELRTSSPDQFTAPQAKGCFPMIVFAVFAGTLLWRMVA